MVFSQLFEEICHRKDPQVQRQQIKAKHHLRELVRMSRGVERESGSVVSGDELAEVIREFPTCKNSLGMDRGFDRSQSRGKGSLVRTYLGSQLEGGRDICLLAQ